MSVPTQARAAAYQQSSVLTAPPGRLVVMLYDGARRFLFQASSAMREGQVLQAHQRLRRAEDIISELNATLDHERGGEIAARLQGIYVFVLGELNRARVEQDPDRIDFAHAQLGELREAWAQAAGA
jgi:flagellar protein FliS